MRLFLSKPSPLAQATSKATPLTSIPSKAARVALALLLATTMTMPLAGCKETDVLTETIIDQDADYTDETLDPIRQESTAGEDDDIQSATEEETADRADEQDNNLPQYDDESESDQSTDQRESEDVAAEYNASEGDDPTNADEASGVSEDPEEEEEESSTPEEGDSEEGAQSEEEDPDADDEEEDTQDPDTSSGQGGTDNIYGSDGTYTDLPDNVRGIAATGLYAIIVQMLAGEGGLVGADEETLETMQKSAAFPGEGVESVRTVWTGSEGARELSLNDLIRSGADVVLTSENDPTVPTDDESLATLDSYGISVVVMPTIGEVDTPDAYITTAIAVVGELLSDAETQYDTAAKAQKYRQMHDEIINSLVDANGGYAQKSWWSGSYGIISGNGSYRIYQYSGNSIWGSETTQGYGADMYTAFADSLSMASVSSYRIWRHDYDCLGQYYLDGEIVDLSDGFVYGQVASGYYTINNSATGDSFSLIDYYLQCAGIANSSTYDSALLGSVNLSYERGFIGTGYLRDTEVNFHSSYPLSFKVGSAYLDEHGHTVFPRCIVGRGTSDGSISFPGIVARNETIAAAIASSANKVNGYYNLGYPYEVYVLPSSDLTGSWADGTPESFLSAIWAYGIFQQNDLSDCTDYVNAYCETFYRCGAGDVINSYGVVYQASCPTS